MMSLDIREQLFQINAYKLYHKDVYMPLELINEATDIFWNADSIKLSAHLKQRHNEDYKHEFELSDIIQSLKNPDYIELFEIETQFGKITKICVRTHLDDRDLCMALAVEDKELLVKTCWRNKVDDLHSTLDVSKYVQL